MVPQFLGGVLLASHMSKAMCVLFANHIMGSATFSFLILGGKYTVSHILGGVLLVSQTGWYDIFEPDSGGCGHKPQILGPDG